jgi:hypothetical protein
MSGRKRDEGFVFEFLVIGEEVGLNKEPCALNTTRPINHGIGGPGEELRGKGIDPVLLPSLIGQTRFGEGKEREKRK